MKINANNSINFSSHNEDVRQADYIARKVKDNFIAHSPSYALESWCSIREDNKTEEALKKRDEYIKKYYIAIDAMRKGYASNPIPKSDIEYCHRICQSVKNLHIANCFEYSMITLASLFANGYKNVYRIIPRVKIELLDKQNEPIKSQRFKLDHVCNLVRTKSYGSIRKSIVVDSWLGKAMPVSEASSEYIELFVAGKEEKYFEKMKEEIRVQGGTISPVVEDAIKNKRYRCSVDFSILKQTSEAEKQAYKTLIENEYSELILNKK